MHVQSHGHLKYNRLSKLGKNMRGGFFSSSTFFNITILLIFNECKLIQHSIDTRKIQIFKVSFIVQLCLSKYNFSLDTFLNITRNTF